MSEYKGIKGFQVQTRTEDPVPYAQALADNPYVGVWGSGGNLNTARTICKGAGTQTRRLAFGGRIHQTFKCNTEEYDGSSWTEKGDLNNARNGFGAGAGTYTSAGLFGGNTPSSSQLEQLKVGMVRSWTKEMI